MNIQPGVRQVAERYAGRLARGVVCFNIAVPCVCDDQAKPAVRLFEALQGRFEISDLFRVEINIFGDYMGCDIPAQSI
jgi:hypothetical protein